jgi:uncharacterized protein (DUF362 family)
MLQFWLKKNCIGSEVELHSVSFVQAKELSEGGLKESISKSISLLKFKPNRKVDKIVIKPNMFYYYHPSTGGATNPFFVNALIDVIRDIFPYDPDIYVVESDASAMRCRHVFTMLQYDELAREKGVKLVNLCEERTIKKEIKIAGHPLQFDIPELLLDCFLVNVPKIKYMRAFGIKFSCAMKNIYGCNAVQKKYLYHKTLSEAIVGLNKIMQTNLVVFDGLVVKGKYTKRLNLVMASENIVAADSAASILLGINPKSEKQLLLASREGLGGLDFVAVGDFIYFKDEFPRKGITDNLYASISSAYLKLFHKL